jgi:hypothetical protein
MATVHENLHVFLHLFRAQFIKQCWSEKCFDQKLYRRIIYYNVNFAYFETTKQKRANAPEVPLCYAILSPLFTTKDGINGCYSYLKIYGKLLLLSEGQICRMNTYFFLLLHNFSACLKLPDIPLITNLQTS